MPPPRPSRTAAPRPRPTVPPGKPQPGDELADVLKPGLTPVERTEADELPVILEIVGIGLHRVRRPADIGEIGQEPVNRADRHVIIPENRPRPCPRTGD